MRLRTGRKVGRTVYVQSGPQPSDDDILVGMMDSPGLAQQMVEAFNAIEGQRMGCGCCPLCEALPGHQHPPTFESTGERTSHRHQR